MKTINAETLYRMLFTADEQLDAKKDEINALNVFPVPDGDTGSNMSMTLSGVRKLTGNSLTGADVCAKDAADLMLRSARGNSGVILSVYFKGFAASVAGQNEINATALADAMKEATKAAYGAVMKPSEGTILTVMRRASEAVGGLDFDSVEALLSCAVSSAKDALDKTPEQLPVLRDAGVVDAGGCGFLTVLCSMCAVAEGAVEAVGFSVPAPTKEVISAAAAYDADIIYPYCTECIVEKAPEYFGFNMTNGLHSFVLSAGDSAVYVEDESIVKLHVHTENPGLILNEAQKYGSLATVKIENMRIQHTGLKDTGKTESKNEFDKETGFVAVANGDGIVGVFEDLGVDIVVFGGQTMNPSTEELLSAVRDVNARTVYLFPNNSNIILTAGQAAMLASENGKTVIVIPSKTVPQGITAMCRFDEMCGTQENTKAMCEAMSHVTTLQTTRAVRDAIVNGIHVKKGQFMGMVENKVRDVSDSLRGCLNDLLRELRGMTCITAFCGSDLNEEETKKVGQLIKEKLGDNVDVTVITGGQPVYSLILAGENI